MTRSFDRSTGTKECSRCRQWLPVVGFGANLWSSSGFDSWYRGCHADSNRRWRPRTATRLMRTTSAAGRRGRVLSVANAAHRSRAGGIGWCVAGAVGRRGIAGCTRRSTRPSRLGITCADGLERPRKTDRSLLTDRSGSSADRFGGYSRGRVLARVAERLASGSAPDGSRVRATYTSRYEADRAARGHGLHRATGARDHRGTPRSRAVRCGLRRPLRRRSRAAHAGRWRSHTAAGAGRARPRSERGRGIRGPPGHVLGARARGRSRPREQGEPRCGR